MSLTKFSSDFILNCLKKKITDCVCSIKKKKTIKMVTMKENEMTFKYYFYYFDYFIIGVTHNNINSLHFLYIIYTKKKSVTRTVNKA